MADDPDFHKVEIHRGDDKIPRDRWGRYLLPHPETGKAQAWTRVTTLAGALKDRYGLERWDWRNIVWGMGQRKALWAQAAAAKLTDTKTLDKIGDRAKEAADAHAGADLGTAIHTFAERVDRGETGVEIPDPFDRDIAAYQMAMTMAGISTCVGWIERVVCVPDLRVPESGVYGVCGTLDRLSNAMEWRLPRIGDIKSATDKERPGGKVTDPIATYGMQDIPLQLAMYSRATHWYDLEAEEWVEMPPIDQDVADLYHIPAGLGECRVWEVDIDAGWKAVELALGIRGWQRRKDLGQVVLSVNADGEIARAGQPEGGDGKASSGLVTRKGGEGEDSSPGDPPASPSPPPDTLVSGGEGRDDAPMGGPEDDDPTTTPEAHGLHPAYPERIAELYGTDGMPEYLMDMPDVEDPLAPADPARVEYCQVRVNAIKESSPDAATRLGQLWGVFRAVPLLPNAKFPERTGPRTWAECSKLVGMLDLVEMEYQLPFPPANDPNPDVVIPSPAERRKEAEEKYQAELTDRRKAASRKAAATRAKNKAKEQST